MVHFYVYYRIDPRQADDAEAAVRTMLARLAGRGGASIRLLQKCDEPMLWLEVHENIADAAAYAARLADEAARADLARFLVGPRRIECFGVPTEAQVTS